MTEARRTPNVTGKAHCRYCCREVDGWIVYDHGNAGRTIEEHELLLKAQKARVKQGLPPIPAYTESLAPCPFCEAGYAAEFAKTERKNTGDFQAPYRDGFWQGRDYSGLLPDCNCDSHVPPPEEQKKMIAELARRLVKPVDPEPAAKTQSIDALLGV